LGKGKKINDALFGVLQNNPYVWFTAKELGWVMRETRNISANSKSLCKRVMRYDDGAEELGGGRVERMKFDRREGQWLNCRYKYRWCPPE
jgi:hypothetical protein